MRRLIAGAAVAASVALPMSASAATAVWAGDVAGSVDMNALTHDLLVELGKAESAKLFAASAGKSGDYTHPIPAGADAFARLFVKNVKDRGLEVAALFS